MTGVFHPEAETELANAVAWYDNARDGLGDEFAAAARKCVADISRDPESWPFLAPGVRRSRIPRFPYDLLFSDTTDGVMILAVAHHHRKPGYWRTRFHNIDRR